MRVSRRSASALSVAVLASVLVCSVPAFAVDGVIEINHAKALAGGATSTDAPGYPVTLDSSGSYRLTGNLTVPDENTDGIVVSAPSVNIDLNGFEIRRSGCEGAVTDCSAASGLGSGVKAVPSTVRGISVKDGSITGMGQFGVWLAREAVVSGLILRWNRIDGILISYAGAVSGNTAIENGNHGITVGRGSTVSGNTVHENTGIGIYATDGSTVSGNTAYKNGMTGISGFYGSTVSGNTVFENVGGGIDASSGSTVSGNTVFRNGSHGILATDGSAIVGNTIGSNTGHGISVGASTGYRDNLFSNNTAGAASGGVNAGGNVCNGSLTCP